MSGSYGPCNLLPRIGSDTHVSGQAQPDVAVLPALNLIFQAHGENVVRPRIHTPYPYPHFSITLLSLVLHEGLSDAGDGTLVYL
jgi:hypothetical protein